MEENPEEPMKEAFDYYIGTAGGEPAGKAMG